MITANPTTTAHAATCEIKKLRKHAKDVLDEGIHNLAEKTRNGDIGFRHTEHEILAELVDGAAWLASDLVGVLHKIAAGGRPPAVMRSDLTRRILEAEVRLEMIRQLSR